MHGPAVDDGIRTFKKPKDGARREMSATGYVYILNAKLLIVNPY